MEKCKDDLQELVKLLEENHLITALGLFQGLLDVVFKSEKGEFCGIYCSSCMLSLRGHTAQVNVM